MQRVFWGNERIYIVTQTALFQIQDQTWTIIYSYYSNTMDWTLYDRLNFPPLKLPIMLAQTCNRELHYLRMNYRFDFPIVWISVSISHIIWEEHGIHCMPCSSGIISAMTPQICYHNNYEAACWCAWYCGRMLFQWRHLYINMRS